MQLLTAVTAGLLLATVSVYAQKGAKKEPPYKFERIDAAALSTKIYEVDSNAHAVVLADVGRTDIVGNNKNWFSLEFRRKTRIHILNKSAYDKATIQIPLWTNADYTERIDGLKATTYNLENGTVTETKLTKENVFEEKVRRGLLIKKFTLPNVKEGSILEFEYKVTSDFLQNLQPWTFQTALPTVWTEYTVNMPQFLEYVMINQGFIPFHFYTKNTNSAAFYVADTRSTGATERLVVTATVVEHRMVMKNVPKLKEESFTSTVENYQSKTEFQLAGFREPLQYKNMRRDWKTLTEELINDEDFGRSLNAANLWMSDDMKDILAGVQTQSEKAHRIYDYVRDHITCTNPRGTGVWTQQPLRQVLKTGKGSVSEVNLLLTAMLRWAGIEAHPVLMSTKSHGFALALYPMLSRFNYIGCLAQIDGQTTWLDAAQPHLGFGRLPLDCYNGFAQVVDKAATPCRLVSDSVREGKITNVTLLWNDNGEWSGNMIQRPGYYESYNLRNEMLEKGQESYFHRMKAAFGVNIRLESAHVDSLKKYDFPIAIAAELKANVPTENTVYINPMFTEAITDNPFKSTERFYPVEMPYSFDKTYQLTMDIPPGYVVDELPKSVRIKLNEEAEGMFEYLVSESNGRISMRTRMRMQRATFVPEEYETLRQFYGMVVNKHKEQIVLKKKLQP